VTLNKVKLSPDGDFSLISDDYSEVQVKGEIIVDTTQAAGYMLGRLERLTATTNT